MLTPTPRTLALLVALLVGLLTAPTARAQDLDPPVVPQTVTDPADTAGPLDLAAATLGQVDTRLVLELQTRTKLSLAGLTADGPKSLCVHLVYGDPGREQATLCAATEGNQAYVLRTPIGEDGQPSGAPVQQPADVTLTPDGKLDVAFSPVDAGLPRARYAWWVTSRWTEDGACAAGCADRAPDAGETVGQLVVLAQPPCFGAAARAKGARCPAATGVTPTPDEALLLPNSRCDQQASDGVLERCDFGVAAPSATTTVALLGDSHAVHWRGAVEVAAQALAWHGVSMTLSGCPYYTGKLALRGFVSSRTCAKHNKAVLGFLRAHPEISAVATSNHDALTYPGDAKAGFRKTFQGLPASVKRIYVLRDTPRLTLKTKGCLQTLVRDGKPIGSRCAQSRKVALLPDPTYAGAKTTKDARVVPIDLTSLMCSTTACPPVVGGVLVNKDPSHITNAFSTTLGPFVLNAFQRALP